MDKLAVPGNSSLSVTINFFPLSSDLSSVLYGFECQYLVIASFVFFFIFGASSSEFHSISSTSESLQNQEELKKWKQKTKIVETEKLKGENKIKRRIKLLWKVVVNSNNYLLFDKALKDYLNAVMLHIVLF